jgi:hypothetical protein
MLQQVKKQMGSGIIYGFLTLGIIGGTLLTGVSEITEKYRDKLVVGDLSSAIAPILFEAQVKRASGCESLLGNSDTDAATACAGDALTNTPNTNTIIENFKRDAGVNAESSIMKDAKISAFFGNIVQLKIDCLASKNLTAQKGQNNQALEQKGCGFINACKVSHDDEETLCANDACLDMIEPLSCNNNLTPQEQSDPKDPNSFTSVSVSVKLRNAKADDMAIYGLKAKKDTLTDPEPDRLAACACTNLKRPKWRGAVDASYRGSNDWSSLIFDAEGWEQRSADYNIDDSGAYCHTRNCEALKPELTCSFWFFCWYDTTAYQNCKLAASLDEPDCQSCQAHYRKYGSFDDAKEMKNFYDCDNCMGHYYNGICSTAASMTDFHAGVCSASNLDCYDKCDDLTDYFYPEKSYKRESYYPWRYKKGESCDQDSRITDLKYMANYNIHDLDFLPPSYDHTALSSYANTLDPAPNRNCNQPKYEERCWQQLVSCGWGCSEWQTTCQNVYVGNVNILTQDTNRGFGADQYQENGQYPVCDAWCSAKNAQDNYVGSTEEWDQVQECLEVGGLEKVNVTNIRRIGWSLWDLLRFFFPFPFF